MRIPACGRAECFPAIAPERHLHRVADSPSNRHRQQKTAASAWAYNAAPMRASLSIRAIIVARGSREQSHCDELWIRADEMRREGSLI